MVFKPRDAFYRCDNCGHTEQIYSGYGVNGECSKCGRPVIIEKDVKGGPEPKPEIKY